MKAKVLLLSALLTGCFGQTYSSTRVGPDRYTVASHGPDTGQENYTKILQHAYVTCGEAGFNDYTVTYVAYDRNRVIAYVKCEPEKKATNGESVLAEIKKLYDDAKRKFEARN